MDPNSNNCQPNANRKQSYQNRFHSAQQQFNSLPPPPQKNPRLDCYANNPHYQPHIRAYNQQQQPANYGHSSYGHFYSPQVLFYVTNFGTHFLNRSLITITQKALLQFSLTFLKTITIPLGLRMNFADLNSRTSNKTPKRIRSKKEFVIPNVKSNWRRRMWEK